MQRSLWAPLFVASFSSFLSACGKSDAPDAAQRSGEGAAEGDLSEYRKSIARYDKIFELNPKDVSAYRGRAVAKRELGDYEGSIADYDKALQHAPNDAASYSGRGFSNLRAGRFESSLADLEKAVEIDPSLKNKLESMINNARERMK